jgi:hypothetical protein
MRDYMLTRSLRGGLPEVLTATTPLTLTPSSTPPTDRWTAGTSATLKVSKTAPKTSPYVSAGPTARVTSLETGSASGSLLRVANVTVPAMEKRAGAPGSPTGTAAADTAATLAAGNAVRDTDADPSAPGGDVIYGSTTGVTSNSALMTWWNRYKLWALGGLGVTGIAFLFWASQRRRR